MDSLIGQLYADRAVRAHSVVGVTTCASMLNYCTKTIRRMIKRGEIRAYKARVGRKRITTWLIPIWAIEEYQLHRMEETLGIQTFRNQGMEGAPMQKTHVKRNIRPE